MKWFTGQNQAWEKDTAAGQSAVGLEQLACNVHALVLHRLHVVTHGQLVQMWKDDCEDKDRLGVFTVTAELNNIFCIEIQHQCRLLEEVIVLTLVSEPGLGVGADPAKRLNNLHV